MYNKIKWIGAFALILCLAAIVIVPASDDVDATGDLDTLSTAIDKYSDDLLGNGQQMVDTTVVNNKLTVYINTDEAVIDDLEIDLYLPYENFKDDFGTLTVQTYDNYGPDSSQRATLTIVNNGYPANTSEFAVRILEKVKEAIIADKTTAKYDGKLIIGSTTYDLEVDINIDSDLKNLGKKIFIEGSNLQIKAEYGNEGLYFTVLAKVTDNLFSVLGSKNISSLMDTKIVDVFGLLAANGVLAKLVTDEGQQSYINTVCDAIINANNFTGFLNHNIVIKKDTKQIAFNASTETTKTGFQGLMDALKIALANCEYKVSDFGALSGNNGTIDFGTVDVITYTAADKTTEFSTIIVKPKLEYGAKTLTVTATGGTAKVNEKTELIVVSGNEYTLKITPDNDYVIDSVSYKIGNKTVKSLYTIQEQTFTVLFGGTTHNIDVVCSSQPVPPQTYTVTVTNDGNGTGAASPTSAEAGTKITLTSEPAEGYVFDKWVSEDVTVATDNTFTMPAKNVTVKATFKQAYTITVNTEGQGSASASAKVAGEGDIIILTATPDEGYMLDSWESEDVTIVLDAFEMPAKNVTITAVFVEIPIVYYTFDIPTGLHGEIFGPSMVAAGETAIFTIVAAENYILNDFIVDGISMGAVAIFTFEDVDSDHTLNATFEYKKGAETDVDPEGNVTESYEDTVDDVEVEVIKETNVDGTSSSTATAYDEETEVATVASITNNGEGEIEIVIASTVEGNEMTETQLEVAQNAAKAAAKAIGIEEEEMDIDVILDATTATQDKEIDVAIDITKYDQKSSIVIAGDKAAIQMDSGTMNGMKKAGNNVKVNVAEKPESSMTDKQKEMAAGNTVFDVNATVNDTRIHMLEGKAYLALPIELPPGATPADVSIYYMTDDGEVSKIATEYVDGAAVGELTHFSMYFAAVNYVDPSAEYTVTVQKSGNGTATASPDKARAGTTITLTATAADGYKFKEWTSADVEIENNSFVMPAGNVTVKAIFEKVEPTPSGGSDNMPYIILAVIIVIALVGCAAFWYFRKS